MNDEKRLEPTDEFLNHHTVEKVETRKAGEKRTRVTDQRWIDYYLKHKIIDSVQYKAAEQLLSLYQAARGNQRVTSKWDGMPAGSGGNTSEHSAIALKDYFKLKWLMGSEYFACVQDIVVHDFSAPEWAKAKGRNPKAAPEIMKMALTDLDDAFRRLRSKSGRV
tara:strand:+ start:293 stop:784 length:492 start_codon:yes stop_codon:yes gene_type:complete